MYFCYKVEREINNFQVREFLNILYNSDLIAHENDSFELLEVLKILDGSYFIFAEIKNFQFGETG